MILENSELAHSHGSASMIAMVSILREQSDALVDQLGEESRRDEELAPFRIELRRRFGGDGLIEGTARTFERCDLLADSDEHVAINHQFGLIARGTGLLGQVVTRDNNGLASDRRDVQVGSLYHPVDVSAGRIVDERID